MPAESPKKINYFQRMEGLISAYTKIFIVAVDNVGSNQMQQIRIALRGEAIILMGKNTLMRKCISEYMKKNAGHPIEQLSSKLIGNVGLVFTNGDLAQIREKIEANRVPAPARVGAIAPCDVIVPPGPTGCDPGQTSFFQVLQVATKIAKGQIEIVSPVQLLTKGDKVGNSEAALLQKLNIRPFSYGLIISSIYDNGSLFDAAVLDLTDEDLQAKFSSALMNVASVCLKIGYPTIASMPHSIANAFKTLVAIAVECENFTFKKADPFKAYLKDPSAFAAAAPVAGGGGGAGAAAPAATKEEVEEEEEVDLGAGDMFGGGDDY